MDAPDDYRPPFTPAELARYRDWHEAAYQRLSALGDRDVEYLGLDLHVPAGVFGPAPVSDLLGRAVLDVVAEGDRVLDMGTGTGVNAILAASRAREVVAVDINPAAVVAARHNVERNGVADRVSVVEGDLFEPVEGTFDLIIYDPPFRWFRPRDLAEAAMADEGYRTLGRFFSHVGGRLSPGGSILVFFGTSGDMGHLLGLADRAGFAQEVLAERTLTQGDASVTYQTFRLRPRG